MNSEKLNQLDNILSSEDALVPSSGFVHSVMASIEAEALQPGPLPFPWKLAIPGLSALGAAFVLASYFFASSIHDTARVVDVHLGAHFVANLTASPLFRAQAAPSLLALAATAVSVVICRRLAGGWAVR